MPISGKNKKRKGGPADSNDGKAAKKQSLITAETGIKFQTYTLDEIRQQIVELCKQVPVIPDDVFGLEEGAVDLERVKQFANEFQAVVETFNVLVSCIGAATYKWGTDRSGAADQNLNLLMGEISSSQDQISSTVTSRLSSVLAPVVELLVDKVIVTKVKVTANAGDKGENGDRGKNASDGVVEEKEIRKNEFIRKGDETFIALCHTILARNAKLFRHMVLSHFEKILRCIKDYLQAQKNDNQSDRSFAY
mmetsp:Transcript_16450/g.45586  ORF Transcript_16450/g.45586 Transcript_16450/m.45586 type:complete len:250 (-) Transcript_16450:231-980(-)|eukprot:CAMPEP_0198110476 /NCGR_PEP_ID=MMETSP1442-20131203/2505_1 /TAXON_ID= /ORGANISM="Craspedostauros australis, Strain CCMP3328" /LENGTH=249 /DNA_ID=CAMNT_0043766563 /DNA_START=295 /DNA_END=1044 /DNA_ORIENTATION=+